MRPTVTICGSARFFDAVRYLAADLERIGVDVNTPDFSFIEAGREITAEQKHALTTSFLEKIRNSDQIYIVAPGGYTGASVCIEAGFAFGLDKRITISEEPAESALAALCDAVASPPEFLASYEAA
jgi:hypothetical protein